ncbi:hypothetical protein CLCR_02692 [Cladophialophora carrionii]|uniref:Uncharacterized protein n=1 Tax=Cladophialophora carrionii TaxID=86049 RepID=A0A1C1CEZ7_9EURO|nr:hypothetical protein CLCR_02692 [Cladophialophora carrionii]
MNYASVVVTFFATCRHVLDRGLATSTRSSLRFSALEYAASKDVESLPVDETVPETPIDRMSNHVSELLQTTGKQDEEDAA